jgi:nucleoside-diphosphate-sugar epimerase
MLVKKVMDGNNPVTIWGSGRQRRNYLHASDCASAILGLVEAKFTGAVNIGTEDTVTLQKLVELICSVAGRQPQLVYDTTKPEGRQIKSSDSTLLRSAYPQFRVGIDLQEGVERMIRWYRDNFATAEAATVSGRSVSA